MKSTVIQIFAIAALLAIRGPACSKSDSESPTEAVGKTVEGFAAQKAASDTEAEARMEACPMAVQGGEVDVADTDAGVALTFTTKSGDVEDLRERVQAMAEMYQAHDCHRHKGPMPAVTAVVALVDQGASITLSPKVDSELELLREHVREHRAHMSEAECRMKQPQAAKKESRNWWTRMLKENRVDRP